MLHVSHRNFVTGGGPHRHPVMLVSDLAIFNRFFVLLVCFALDFVFIVHCLVVRVHSFLTEALWKVKFNEETTELVNIKRDTKLIHQLTFGNVVLEDKPHHKHLGIHLQNNCKRDEHISNISSKVNMLINCLRHFKYKLGRKALEIMYKSFILPFF